MTFRRVRVLSPAEAAPEWTAAAERVEALLQDHGLVAVPPGESGAADGWLALPGGVASLDDLFRQWIGEPGRLARVPCGLLNSGDYYARLLRSAGDATMEQFVQETQRGALIVERDPATLLRALVDFRPPETRRQLA